MMEGLPTGRTMVRNAWKREAPSIRAASISSVGMARKLEVRKNVPKGSASAV
jgi:hypothetical protein